MNRRRFLTVTAGLGLLPALRGAWAAPPATTVWRGTALGSGAVIAMVHPEAERMIAIARAEIDRLEGIFSLYRADSALARLNRDGRLDAPPFELLECLGLCGAVHQASGGRFDPTVQPLWAAHAEAWAKGAPPDPAVLAAARALTGWRDVAVSESAVVLARPGMALTLNGVAQGVIADRVADRLRAEGLADVLVDTGEIRALGGERGTDGWPVTLSGGPRLILSDRALATSAPLGTAFDPAGQVGHILNPASGLPAGPVWRAVSISAPRAGLADALSTAACLIGDQDGIAQMAAHFPDVRVEMADPVAA
ncbi:FAD:protein FMN transferase [Paracoccus sp. p4-l81]|uniref:FAD:protein FMN transferase n=1 Tax=unclassified Paracoccus (in: a-proteobacteria) TaxID=2688777 RepID=UPI0035B86F1D